MKCCPPLALVFWLTVYTVALPDEAPPRLPAGAENLLLKAKCSGNLEGFNKGRRGAPNQMLFDPLRGDFAHPSEHHEYGVGFQQALGVVAEERAAWWMAAWTEPVEANLICLSGAYPNQPQPNTAWKIELRRGGQWTEHARGTGGWYNNGRYVWGDARTEPVQFDALRVSLFSKDDKTPLSSVHFRGEKGFSWIVAKVAPIDAVIVPPAGPLRAGAAATFAAEALAGEIATWRWDFGDAATAEGRAVSHAFAEPGDYAVKLTASDGRHTIRIVQQVTVSSPIAVDIEPLGAAILAGQPFACKAKAIAGKPTAFSWDFGDGALGHGAEARHTFAKPGIYQVKLTGSDSRHSGECLALLRVHTPETRQVPQVVLDTDQKNEQDDQHYFGYALFSELDVLGVNSVHHGGGQEEINYREILHVLDLAKQSGLGDDRVPRIFRGANQRLAVPASSRWEDTQPIVTAASHAILAAARGAAPGNPVWIVPVGPATNVASAILQARADGLDLKGRIRIIWLGGSNHAITREFNGNNDPWSMYVVAQSGIETWIVPAPVGARVAIDKRTEGHLYADHPLGQYLKRIVPDNHKPLFDATALSAIISFRLGTGWVKEVERVAVAGPQKGYVWTPSDDPQAVRVIRQIDQQAMQRDLFDSMKGRPTRLRGVAGGRSVH